MEAKELRIGNLFLEQNSKEIISVIGLENNRIIFSGMFLGNWQATPISTTIDWLLKFGFKEIKNEPTQWLKIKTKKRGVSLEIDVKRKRTILFYNGIFVDIKYPDTIHQLQNLYLALTGEELTLTNPTEIKKKLL